MKISGKGTKQLLTSMEINGNATPNLETAAYLCASYAQAMRKLCASYARNHTTPLGLADQLASAALRRLKISISGASLAPSVFGLVVNTANTHKTNEIQ